MNLGIICEINSNNPIGFIAIEKETGDIGYITKDNDLDEVIDIILNNEELEIPIKENINNFEIIRNVKITAFDSNYLMAFNYYLPYPWRILGVKNIDGNMNEVLEESFNCMEEL